MQAEEIPCIEEVRTAYADAGPQDQSPAYTRGMRCLSFLTSEWLDTEEAAEAVQYIGPYNCFDPEAVAEYLDRIFDVDHDARVAIGREGSPVLYVETNNPSDVIAVLNTELEAFNDPGGVFGATSPDELGALDDSGAVGSARKDLYGDGEDQIDPHQSCTHSEPPVPVEEYAPVSDDKAYVRAWWD